jgi:hypothetical protein
VPQQVFFRQHERADPLVVAVIRLGSSGVVHGSICLPVIDYR